MSNNLYDEEFYKGEFEDSELLARWHDQQNEGENDE